MADRSRNQFTPGLTNQQAADWLLSKATPTFDPSGFYRCLILNKQKGIDINPTTGYRRFNLNGSKFTAHKFIYEVKVSPLEAEHEVSHLCGNRGCCNPSHLVQETRQSNMSRIGCLGHIIDHDNKIYKVCTHTPTCKITRKLALEQVQLIRE